MKWGSTHTFFFPFLPDLGFSPPACTEASQLLPAPPGSRLLLPQQRHPRVPWVQSTAGCMVRAFGPGDWCLRHPYVPLICPNPDLTVFATKGINLEGESAAHSPLREVGMCWDTTRRSVRHIITGVCAYYNNFVFLPF